MKSVKESLLCTEMKILKSNQGDKTFVTKSGFERHIEHHTGQYKFVCNFCNKGYSNKYNYELHVRAHEGRGYACDYCGKMFKTKQCYHESEHTGQYRFRCEKCGKGFNEQTFYEKHNCM